MTTCDVLIPTIGRPEALALTLGGLAGQIPDAVLQRVLVADQSEEPAEEHPLVAAMVRTLRNGGVDVDVRRRPHRRGLAEQRDFLLARARADHVLFLDDDVWLRPWSVATMRRALDTLGCGFVGMAVQGLSYLDDHRPDELTTFEPWDGSVQPEEVAPGSPAWARHELHNAANPSHLAQRCSATPEEWVAYRIAWVGGCVLFHRPALDAVGGFSFWPRLPVPHAGEDVLVQLRVMRRFGGAGVLPSGAVHLELPTTVPERPHEAYLVEDVFADVASSGGYA